jgi:hypothetical protein
VNPQPFPSYYDFWCFTGLADLAGLRPGVLGHLTISAYGLASPGHVDVIVQGERAVVVGG